MTEYAVFGILINELSIFGMGMLLGVLGILFGIARGMSSNHRMWALTFSTFAWITSFVMVDTIFASTIFAAACIGYILTFQPMISDLGQSNVYIVAAMSMAIHLVLAFMLMFNAAYTETQTDQDIIQSILDPALDKLNTEYETRQIEAGVCDPADNECTDTATTGGFDSGIFDTLASIINIGKFAINALKFIGYIVLAPFVIGVQIAGLAANGVVSALVGLLAFFWNLTNLYNLYKFILNKRGV